jgi:hypothetical protein
VKTATGGNYIYRASYVGMMDGTEVRRTSTRRRSRWGTGGAVHDDAEEAQKLAERDMFLATAIEFPSNKKAK